LFRRKAELVLVGLERVDALEQHLVQIGLAAVAREHRRDCALDRLQFVIGRCACKIEKNIRNPVEAAPAALECLDRIGEARRRRVGGDRVDLRRACLSAASNAGRKWRGSKRSNGGASNGPVQGSRSGFVSIGELVMRALAARPSAMRQSRDAQPGAMPRERALRPRRRSHPGADG